MTQQNIPSQPSDASVLIPQHNYKLDVHALNGRHPGQVRIVSILDNEILLTEVTVTVHTSKWCVSVATCSLLFGFDYHDVDHVLPV